MRRESQRNSHSQQSQHRNTTSYVVDECTFQLWIRSESISYDERATARNPTKLWRRVETRFPTLEEMTNGGRPAPMPDDLEPRWTRRRELKVNWPA